MFNALVLEKGENGLEAAIKSIDLSALQDYPVLVEVFYSSLNYKDALAITDKAPIARRSRFGKPEIKLSLTVLACLKLNRAVSPVFKK